MRFEELDARMRALEQYGEIRVTPGTFPVARLDGRAFTGLTKKVLELERPFDERFRDLMVATAEHTMTTGVKILYAFIQSDEISLLIDPASPAFGRRVLKICSILAGEASGFLSVALSRPVCFDCRLAELPTEEEVVDYFRWRAEDARRNGLRSHAYWMLRRQGKSGRAAERVLTNATPRDVEGLLAENDVRIADLPAWHTRGIAVQWERITVIGRDPRTGEERPAERRRLTRLLSPPRGDELEAHLRTLLTSSRDGEVPSTKQEEAMSA